MILITIDQKTYRIGGLQARALDRLSFGEPALVLPSIMNEPAPHRRTPRAYRTEPAPDGWLRVWRVR